MQRRTGGPFSRLLASLSPVPADAYRYPTELLHQITMEAVATILFLIVFAAVFTGSIAWGVKEFQSRDAGSGWLLLLWLFGPVTLFAWFAFRPKRLVDRTPDDFSNADDQIAAAARLESLGDLKAAQHLLTNAAARWPEHDTYITNMMNEIDRKLVLQGADPS
ncbi:hypothetical protein CA13_00350 [Planctomycetes bacterium CA13]|uniref:Uncharacterized protein n=1 Tax=Novipirellula herctigrandis TaxID=2527986 RepID=A0A5C5YUD9_9BACT|nr:hypothetical protein CA13_00350 [Planctomycetes bacterium CA13]